MPAFVRLELWDKLQCQSTPTKLGVLYPRDLAGARDIMAIDDQESLTFQFARVDVAGATRTFYTKLVARLIATVVWDDGSFDEWRVSQIEDGRGLGGGVNVTCNPLILDLAEGADSSTGKGLVSSVSNCLRVFDFAAGDLTATEMWDTYIIPACPSWVARGTIDSSVSIPAISWDRLTPQALALQVRDALRKLNVSCELRLRRNGTSGYLLDLVTQVGASATVPLFHPRTNLQSLKRRFDATQEATRLFVTGETDPSGLAGIPGRARWLVSNVDGAAGTLTLADPNGGAGPIAMTNQWANAYVVRCLTGRSFQISASDATTQKVTTSAVSTFVAGEFVELRLTEPLTNTRGIASPNTRYAISSVSTNNLTLSGNPIIATNEYVDWYAKVWTAASAGSVVGTPQRISASVAATDIITVASGSGFNNTMYVEFLQLDGAGEIPSYLEHATDIQANPTGYGVKCGDLAVTSILGVTNIAPNGWMRTWSNPSNPPDGWSLITSGTPGPTSQNANPLYTRYGGVSYQVDFFGNLLVSPRIDPIVAVGNTVVSLRIFILFTTFSPPAGQVINLRLYKLLADGSLGSILGNNDAVGVLNAWLMMEIDSVDLGLTVAPYGVVAVIQANPALSAAAQFVAYVDSLEVYQFATPPAETSVYEFGDATALHQTGNRQLLANGAPPVSYELTIADLERSDPTTWSRNLTTLGGSVRAVDSDFGVDTTVRLLRRERDLLRPERSTVGLATLPPLLSHVVQTT